MTTSDIQMQVIVIYNLIDSLQFCNDKLKSLMPGGNKKLPSGIKELTLFCEFSRWPMLQCLLNFCIDLFFGWIFLAMTATELLKKNNNKA